MQPVALLAPTLRRKRLEESPVARITLDHLAHAYKSDPRRPEDYALKEVNHVWS